MLAAHCADLKNGKEEDPMNAATVIAVIVIAAILFFAVRYIYKEKKKGKACIGCPYADSCPKHRQNGAACGGSTEQKKANLQ